jgi:hypothetical protein
MPLLLSRAHVLHIMHHTLLQAIKQCFEKEQKFRRHFFDHLSAKWHVLFEWPQRHWTVTEKKKSLVRKKVHWNVSINIKTECQGAVKKSPPFFRLCCLEPSYRETGIAPAFFFSFSDKRVNSKKKKLLVPTKNKEIKT